MRSSHWHSYIWNDSPGFKINHRPDELKSFLAETAGLAGLVLTSARISKRWLDIYNGRVTWLGGSGHHFCRCDQVRQPSDVAIGIW
jgi:hypothetical protein